MGGRVEWVTATRGDGLGYDIESFNRDGTARATTTCTCVFNFASAPSMYPLTGALDQVCRLEPQSFVARVG